MPILAFALRSGVRVNATIEFVLSGRDLRHLTSITVGDEVAFFRRRTTGVLLTHRATIRDRRVAAPEGSDTLVIGDIVPLDPPVAAETSDDGDVVHLDEVPLGLPPGTAPGLMESAALFDAETPPYAAIYDQILRAYDSRCALTHHQFPRATATSDAIRAVPIWPRHFDGPLHVRNYLLLRRDMATIWNAGIVSATDDFHIVAVLAGLEPHLLEAIHPSGRLYVPADPQYRPDRKYLGWHRQFILGQR